MARQLRIEFPGAFYHVTSRGNERKAIFKSQRDREKFLSYLETASQRYGAIIHVYCLMNNHYHILIETPLGNLSQIMQHINGAYTTYFNVKRARAGHLFQGRYKSILVEVDEYAKELSRYIHLNPVRARIVDNPEDYQWSSYPYYAVIKKAPGWLCREFILGYFDSKLLQAQRKYGGFVHSLFGKEYESPLTEIIDSIILGKPDFVAEIKDRFLGNKKHDRNLPILRALSNRPDIEKIIETVDSVIGSDNKLSRQIKLYLCHRYSGRKLKEIGIYFDIGESGVSQTTRRVSEKLNKDKKLIRKINRIKNNLNL
jgi:REP element-mobilizing transposase RayT